MFLTTSKKGNWTLSGILGIVGVAGIILPLLGVMSKWWIILGFIFLYLAFNAKN